MPTLDLFLTWFWTPAPPLFLWMDRTGPNRDVTTPFENAHVEVVYLYSNVWMCLLCLGGSLNLWYLYDSLNMWYSLKTRVLKSCACTRNSYNIWMYVLLNSWYLDGTLSLWRVDDSLNLWYSLKTCVLSSCTCTTTYVLLMFRWLTGFVMFRLPTGFVVFQWLVAVEYSFYNIWIRHVTYEFVVWYKTESCSPIRRCTLSS